MNAIQCFAAPYIRARLAFSLIAILLASPIVYAAEETITNVSMVRALTPERAVQQLPVRLRGVVTYYDGLDNHAFIQDGTGGIFFRPGFSGQPGSVTLDPGEQIEIEGFTWQGRFSPSVVGNPNDPLLATVSAGERPVRIQRLGRASIPVPPVIPIDQILTGAFHDQLVRVKGVVREWQLYRGNRTLGFRISSERGGLIAKHPNFDLKNESEVQRWLNVESEFIGVVGGGANQMGQLNDIFLLIPTMSYVRPDFSGTDAFFQRPPQAFSDVLRYDPNGMSKSRVTVSGTVTLAKSKTEVYLASGADALWVQSPQEIALKSGDLVAIAAYPSHRGGRVFLEDGIVRVLGEEAAPKPRLMSAKECAAKRGSGQLVSTEGLLVADWQAENFRMILLEADGMHFTARILTGINSHGATELATGSLLQICGVIEFVTADQATKPPGDFHLLVHSPVEINVLRGPSWWTPVRLVACIGIGLALLGVVLLWALILRREVARRTEQIRTEINARLAIESVSTERRRLAADLHDTLEQTLTGAAFQLETAVALDCVASEAEVHLNLAHRLMDRSREELRRAIWDLTPGIIEERGIVSALRKVAQEMCTTPACNIVICSKGDDRIIPDRIAAHLFRVAQEAITNALKHGRPSRIEIAFEATQDEVVLRVIDDGTGFDSNTAPGPEEGHFGLRGMLERIKRLGGFIRLTSGSGGTTVSVHLPTKLLKDI